MWHLCCTLKRSWVMSIPAEPFQRVVVPPLLFPEVCRPVYLGCVHTEIQAPPETCNQRTHYLDQVCCTRVLVVSLSLLNSHWFLCAVHTERWLSCILSSSQPPSSDEQYGRRGCVHSLGWLGLCRGQHKCCCPGRPTESLSCVWAGCLWSEGPWGLDFL